MPEDQEGQPASLSDDQRAAFAARVSQALGSDQALTGAAVAAYTPRGRAPAVVARPASVEAARAAVALAFEAGAATVPWGAGSRQALGYAPERCDLVLSLERLTRVIAYDPADLTITVEAGITHTMLNDRLAPNRQTLPFDPPLPARATIGGTLATAVSGLRGTLYGEPRDLVLGVDVVDVAGEAVRAGGAVVKNSTGYNMRRLYTGSLGAFGIITAASFKLIPAPAFQATLIAACAVAQQAQASAAAASQLATRPATIAAVHPSSLPELARLGDYHQDDALLAVRLPGEESAVRRAAATLERALHDAGAEPLLTLDTEGTSAFWASVNDFPALRTGPREALIRASTLPSEAMSALDLAQSLALQHDLTLRWLVDLQSGALWLRLWAPDATLSASTIAFTNALRDTLASLTRRWPHTVLLACPDAYIADIPVWGADPETLPLMREIKRQFDPGRLLNPGRLAGRL